jgi:hypothetical protein
MKFDRICNAILERVFHGTPHDIVGSFDLNEIGSGEGAQVYGWGLYFAENKSVAIDYQKKLSGGEYVPIESLRKYFTAGNIVPSYGGKDRVISFNEGDDGDWSVTVQEVDERGQPKFGTRPRTHFTTPNIKDIKAAGLSTAIGGNLYTVDIDADKENDFLDWGKPASEQSDLVKRAFENIKKMEATDTEIYKKMLDTHGEDLANSFIPEIWKRLGNIGETADDGKNYYKDLSKAMGYNEKAASELLFKFGIKGIRYLDQGSRGSGEGTYNYVIFDPSIIKIVAKNGEFVMNSKKPENVEI